MTESIYDKLSNERKKLQAEDSMPEWWSTGGWQLFKEKYLYDAKTPKEQYERIATTLAQYIDVYPDWWEQEFGSNYSWKDAFFDIFWTGDVSGSTPVLSNTGTDRGMSVSCSGTVIHNSIVGIYDAKREVAVLTKNAFGTASFLGNIQPRGSKTDKGVISHGVLPVIEGFVKDMSYVAQGANRRGAWAGYLPIDHGDFYEVCDYLKNHPDGLNIGWCVSNDFVERLNNKDEDALQRYQKMMVTKMITGKGYIAFIDKANALRPIMYVDKDLKIVAPQLCNEVMLHSSEELSYTCVLSSMNAVHAKRIMKNKSVFIATVMLDCVAEDYIRKSEGIKGLEKTREFTIKGRALGLGVCGFHTYLQMNMIPFDSMECYLFNDKFFKHIHDQSLEASQWLAKVLGEPEWCKGYGVRNTHRTAVAPTKSSSLIMGGISEGINPDPAMTYTQLTPAGEVDRANPVLLKLMKERGVYDKKHMQELTDSQGSVQNVSWLTDEEKLVFRTAFEIPMKTVVDLTARRQRYICQGQSMNLFFSADEDEEYISEVIKECAINPYLLGVYYIYTKTGVAASKDECVMCQ